MSIIQTPGCFGNAMRERSDQFEMDMLREKLLAVEKDRDEWRAKAEALIPLAIGWMYAEACVLMDKGEDIREIEAPYFLSRALLDLGQPKDARSAEKEKE